MALASGRPVTLSQTNVVLRWQVMQRLGGFTGDVAGAMLEIIECGSLLVIASATPHI